VNIFYAIFLTFYLIFFLIRIFGKSKIQFIIIKKVERIEGRNIEKGFYETKILFDPFRWLRNLMMYNKGNYLSNGTKLIYLKKPKPTIIETINKFYMEFFIFFTQELDKKRMLEEINNFKEYKEKLIQNFSKGMVKNYNAITGGVNKEIFVENDILTKNLPKYLKTKVLNDLEMSMEKHPGMMLVVPFNKDKCAILRSNLTTNKNALPYIKNKLGIRSELNTVKLTVGEYFSYLKDFQICIFDWKDIEGLIREGMIKSYKISNNQLEALEYSIRKGIKEGEIKVVDNINKVNGKKFSIVYDKEDQPFISILRDNDKENIIAVFKRENIEMSNIRLPRKLIEDYTKIIEKIENKD
jgi:hypothetical protein